MPHQQQASRIWLIPLLALLLTLSQVALSEFLIQGSDWGKAYHQLCQWDCGWYSSIVKNGYRSTIPPVKQDPEQANVAYFPGYPILARTLHLGAGFSVKTSLLLVSQIACFAFWVLFL